MELIPGLGDDTGPVRVTWAIEALFFLGILVLTHHPEVVRYSKVILAI